jgi:hypothetical protein
MLAQRHCRGALGNIPDHTDNFRPFRSPFEHRVILTSSAFYLIAPQRRFDNPSLSHILELELLKLEKVVA